VAPTVLAIEWVNEPEPVPGKKMRVSEHVGILKGRKDGRKRTCFNHDAAWSDVEPRCDEGDVGEIKDLCPVR
jgi:hypothetical protein